MHAGVTRQFIGHSIKANGRGEIGSSQYDDDGGGDYDDGPSLMVMATMMMMMMMMMRAMHSICHGQSGNQRP